MNADRFRPGSSFAADRFSWCSCSSRIRSGTPLHCEVCGYPVYDPSSSSSYATRLNRLLSESISESLSQVVDESRVNTYRNDVRLILQRSLRWVKHHHLHRKLGAKTMKLLTSYPFLCSSDKNGFPGEPMDLSQIERKLREGEYIKHGRISRALTCGELALQMTPGVLAIIHDMRLLCSTADADVPGQTSRHRQVMAHAMVNFFETYLRIELEKWFARVSAFPSLVDSLQTAPLIEFLCQANNIPALHYIRDQGVTVGSDVSTRRMHFAQDCPVYIQMKDRECLVSGRVLRVLDGGSYEVLMDGDLEHTNLKSDSLRLQSTAESEFAFDYDYWEKALVEGRLESRIADLSSDAVASEISTDELSGSGGEDMRADNPSAVASEKLSGHFSPRDANQSQQSCSKQHPAGSRTSIKDALSAFDFIDSPHQSSSQPLDLEVASSLKIAPIDLNSFCSMVTGPLPLDSFADSLSSELADGDGNWANVVPDTRTLSPNEPRRPLRSILQFGLAADVVYEEAKDCSSVQELGSGSSHSFSPNIRPLAYSLKRKAVDEGSSLKRNNSPVAANVNMTSETHPFKFQRAELPYDEEMKEPIMATAPTVPRLQHFRSLPVQTQDPSAREYFSSTVFPVADSEFPRRYSPDVATIKDRSIVSHGDSTPPSNKGRSLDCLEYAAAPISTSDYSVSGAPLTDAVEQTMVKLPQEDPDPQVVIISDSDQESSEGELDLNEIVTDPAPAVGGGKKSHWYYVESDDAWEEYKQRQRELRRINPAHIDEPFDLYSEKFARQPRWKCLSCGKENLAVDRKCEVCGTRKRRIKYAEFSKTNSDGLEFEDDDSSEASDDDSDEYSDIDTKVLSLY